MSQLPPFHFYQVKRKYFYTKLGIGQITGEFAVPRRQDIQMPPPVKKNWNKSRLVEELVAHT